MSHTPSQKKIIEIATRALENNPNITLKELANVVAEAGLINTRTRKPYTLSTMYYTLSRMPEMLRFRAGKTYKKLPLIIRMKNFPNITEWLLSTAQGEIVNEKDLTIEMVKSRELYGICDLPIMLAADKVWWVFDGKQPLLRDRVEGDNIRMRYVKLQVMY